MAVQCSLYNVLCCASRTSPQPHQDPVVFEANLPFLLARQQPLVPTFVSVYDKAFQRIYSLSIAVPLSK